MRYEEGTEERGGECSMQRGNEKRKERSERRGALVRREVAAGITERIVSLNVRGAPRESLRPSPSLARGNPLAGWQAGVQRTHEARRYLLSFPCPQRNDRCSAVHFAVGYTSASAPGGIFRTTMSEERGPKGGGREASFFFYAA